MKMKLQNNWDLLAKERKYIAVVNGVPKQSGQVTSWLKETKTLMTYSSSKPNDGKKAITNYRVVSSNDNYSLVDIEIKTGRKNQIRVHMKDIGHSIVGDHKYGNKDGFRKMYLHAYKLTIEHPITGKVLEFETEVPNSFIDLIS